MIVPALIEANAPGYRRIKYALFPPLGLASLASYLDPLDEVELLDEHVHTPLQRDDQPRPARDERVRHVGASCVGDRGCVSRARRRVRGRFAPELASR
jgi:hypothetical protein